MTQPNLEYVQLRDLTFDPDNPRLPDRYKHSEESDVLKYLLLECNLTELMMSIGEKGFFVGEPLMVTPVGDSGVLRVIEGNRRLGALKLLQPDVQPPVQASTISQIRQSAKYKPVEIPVLIFEKREDILSYLGYRHITGIKEWDALAKARYLKQLRDLHSDADDETVHKALAKEIGSKSNVVARLLTGLSLLEKAQDLGILEKLRLEPDDIPFSLLTTGIGWENIQNFIGIDGTGDVEAKDIKPREFEEFFTWVFAKVPGSSTVLGESRNFQALARVVASPEALALLRRGEPLDRADLLTSGPLDAIRQHLAMAEKSLQSAQETLSLADGLTAEDLAHAERVRRASISLHSSLKSLIEDDDAEA
ncbi:conserved hypothetical protein [Agrobacterium tumefaciens str. CFBP 5621]|uniref:ParB N-terminal domain-containing protein n=1 Tax=Agrobacterium tumefaciens TaxID=358 RepID=UPI0009B9ACB5|nr:ParB N-terminal domain-containing protein [Agrobacterium tumefaciens]CUX50703.1 conserved hypothetical protein [Agrobacterium tumefaciens str. CFBP 5621]